MTKIEKLKMVRKIEISNCKLGLTLALLQFSQLNLWHRKPSNKLVCVLWDKRERECVRMCVCVRACVRACCVLVRMCVCEEGYCVRVFQRNNIGWKKPKPYFDEM
jgi:hypothetical protein